MNTTSFHTASAVVPAVALRSGRRMALGLAALLLSGAALAPHAARAQQPIVSLPDFTELVDRVGPSVVNIRTTERRVASGGAGGSELDPNIEEFFRRFGIPIPNRPGPGRGGRGAPGADDEPAPRGIGSGFILSADGYIMTNAHVVDGAEDVVVTLTDKRELKARIVGFDKRTDVAVVKVDAGNLPFVKIGDVNKLKVGEWVVAIGSPFNLENTVTAGIVSAKQRDTGDFLPLIQTDVAINPGNSGGPLLNMRGEVVGINSQIYSRSGGFMGISFAIPIDEAVRVADQLRATGRVIRGRIGVTIGPVRKDVAESIGLGPARGALVSGVEKSGPADKGGIEAGDIIVKVDGRAVEKSGDLPRIVGGIKPGSKSALQVFRRGSLKDISVTVAEFEAEKPARRAGAEPSKPAPTAKTALGLTVSDIGEAQKGELGLKGGVRVDAVEGAAARSGVREGDVILSVDNVEVADTKQFSAAAAKADKSKAVSVLVRRGDWTNFIVIKGVR
ncbi:MAG: Do family serine endopeptidase [Pseudomonadota bacterium]|nr:Do family serine endopeptidase [Pseudomonadota bacterium]